ncbi:MAG TPA: hypothetical protein VJ001_07255, partial [Rhodocyclaceae bacterium]|nr:hypothetical protein [Rhodocyclaceae bacterium]
MSLVAGANYRLEFASAARQRHARAWLLLATLAVTASSVFAILIVLARVPALGVLFPGAPFYRIALTLHVNLSQWVWFMAFAAVLWTAAARREPGWLDTLVLWLGALGALAMACSPLLGPVAPITSNYIPVLDTPWFLAGLALYGVAVSIKAGGMLLAAIRPASADFYRATLDWGLWLAALCLLCAVALLARVAVVMPAESSGLAYFETLFWAAGHVWQFCLVLLMMLSWLCCLPPQVSAPPPRPVAALLALGALPALVALAPGMLWDVGDATYFGAFTTLMQWTTWPAPVLLVGAIVAASRHAPLSVALSWGLLAAGLVLG